MKKYPECKNVRLDKHNVERVGKQSVPNNFINRCIDLYFEENRIEITDNNKETVEAIAKQERRSFNGMLNLLIEDATSGELIKKTSVKEFLKANPKASHEQIIEYFGL